MAIEVEVKLPDYVSGPAKAIADKLDAMHRKVLAYERGIEKQAQTTSKAVREVESDLDKQARAQAKAAEKAAAATDKENKRKADKLAAQHERDGRQAERASLRKEAQEVKAQERTAAKLRTNAEREQARAARRAERERERSRKKEEQEATKAKQKEIDDAKKYRSEIVDAVGLGGVLGGNLAAMAAGKIVGAIGSAIRGGWEAAKRNSDQSFAFDATLRAGSVSDDKSTLLQAKYFDLADVAAQRLGKSVSETRDEMRHLLELKLSPTQAMDFIKLGASAKAMGKEAAASAVMMETLAKIHAKGRLDNSDIEQLNEKTGISRPMILEAMGDIQALGRSATLKEYEAVMKNANGGFTKDEGIALVSKAMSLSLGEKSVGALAIERADKTLGGTMDRLAAKLETAGNKFVEQFGGATEKFIDFVNNLDPIGFAEEAAATVKAVSGASTFSFLDDLLSGNASVRPKEEFVEFNFWGDDGYEQRKKEFETKQLQEAKSVGEKIGKNFGEGQASGMRSTLESVKSAGAEVGAAAEEGARDKLETQSPSKVGFRIGLDFDRGVIGGQEYGLPFVEKASERTASAIVPDQRDMDKSIQEFKLPSVDQLLYGSPEPIILPQTSDRGDPVYSPGQAALSNTWNSSGGVSIGAINVTVPGGDNPAETAALVGPAIRRAIEDYVDELALQVGG